VRNCIVGLVLFFACGAHGSRVSEGVNEVKTASGPVIGDGRSSLTAYLGIPYAKAPTGNLRWKPPVPVDPWTKPLLAIDYGKQCPQLSFILRRVIGDEDCLNLNVWKPKTKTDKPLPVMVFIHGGANSIGASNQKILKMNLYDGQYLASEGPVIVVSLNYRLGLLGFMAHPELSKESGYGGSGNYALMDQILALKWVQENIAAFGGDPNNVTAFGESAGAINLMALMASPEAKGLFHRAIIQSGFLSELSLADAERQGSAAARALGCAGPDALAKLRALPVEDILNYVHAPFGGLIPYSATIDGHLLPSGVLESFQKGTFNKVPTIIGTTADEMKSLAPMLADSANIAVPADYERRVIEYFGEKTGLDVLVKYPARGAAKSPREVFETMLTDAYSLCPARRIARAFNSNGAPVYKYLFSHSNDYMRGWGGAFHGIDLTYVFNTHLGTQREYDLSKQVMTYWTSFARDGRPDAPGKTQWPRYSREEYLSLNIPSNSEQGYREGFCDFWDSVGELKANPLIARLPLQL
jgi:para-nitrobenzyl esterase